MAPREGKLRGREITLRTNQHQHIRGPISVFGGYKHADIDFDGGGDDSVDAIQIGLRFNFETGDLAERSKTGASLIGGQSAVENYIYDF